MKFVNPTSCASQIAHLPYGKIRTSKKKKKIAYDHVMEFLCKSAHIQSLQSYGPMDWFQLS
jgi:hypothetical protein